MLFCVAAHKRKWRSRVAVSAKSEDRQASDERSTVSIYPFHTIVDSDFDGDLERTEEKATR